MGFALILFIAFDIVSCLLILSQSALGTVQVPAETFHPVGLR